MTVDQVIYYAQPQNATDPSNETKMAGRTELAGDAWDQAKASPKKGHPQQLEGALSQALASRLAALDPKNATQHHEADGHGFEVKKETDADEGATDPEKGSQDKDTSCIS